MEKELGRKEKDKELNIRIALENMTPRCHYTSLTRKIYVGQIISKNTKSTYDSSEARNEARREKDVMSVIYIRESEIPKVPRELPMKSSFSDYPETIPLNHSQQAKNLANIAVPIPAPAVQMPMPTPPAPQDQMQPPQI